jgi:hypothetical protein
MKPNAVIAVLVILVFVFGAYFVTNRQNTGSVPEEKPVVANNVPVSAQVAVPAVPPKIAALLKKAESGDTKAQFKLGRAYESGDGTPQDKDEALRRWSARRILYQCELSEMLV